MIPVFEYYTPQGPLAYLLMNKEGKMILGLFEEKTTGGLVLIYNYSKEYYVLDPGMDFMEIWMRNEANLGTWALNVRGHNIKSTDGFPLPLHKLLIIKLNLFFALNKPIQEICGIVLYPNYYYLYRELMLSRRANLKAPL